MHAFCRGNGESRTEVKPKLSPKHAPRARAGTVGFYRTDRTHLAKQILMGVGNRCPHQDVVRGGARHYSQTQPSFCHRPTHIARLEAPNHKELTMPLTSESTAVWNETLLEGDATVVLDSSGTATFPLTWKARSFGTENTTNPEELLAAAHASCFSMA